MQRAGQALHTTICRALLVGLEVELEHVNEGRFASGDEGGAAECAAAFAGAVHTIVIAAPLATRDPRDSHYATHFTSSASLQLKKD